MVSEMRQTDMENEDSVLPFISPKIKAPFSRAYMLCPRTSSTIYVLDMTDGFQFPTHASSEKDAVHSFYVVA